MGKTWEAVRTGLTKYYRKMKVKIHLDLIITLVVILFVSCDKNNEKTHDDEPLIISYRCSSGWVGLDENLKITPDSTYYSIFHDLAEINYQSSVKTTKEQWNNLINTFNFRTFTKIQNESCEIIYDAPVNRFSVTVNGEIHSFYNGECDKNFLQMRGFFDLILEQNQTFRKNAE
jgi:hypothetical protein